MKITIEGAYRTPSMDTVEAVIRESVGAPRLIISHVRYPPATRGCNGMGRYEIWTRLMPNSEVTYYVELEVVAPVL